MFCEIPAILACPECTCNRFLPSWFLFVILRFAALWFVAHPRLDVVRTMGVLAVLEAPYFYLWRLGVMTWYFGSDSAPEEIFGAWYSIVFQLGIPQAIGLVLISRIRYFRSVGSPRLQVRRALLIIPLFIAVHFAQGLLAFSALSSTTGR